MLPEQTREVICSSLGISTLDEVFQDLDLAKPLGSATIAQASKSPFAVQRLQFNWCCCGVHRVVHDSGTQGR